VQARAFACGNNNPFISTSYYTSNTAKVIGIAKSFFRYGKPYNPPCPPFNKGGNYKELLLKSPFDKEGFIPIWAQKGNFPSRVRLTPQEWRVRRARILYRVAIKKCGNVGAHTQVRPYISFVAF
jgi:hypothetical protein